MEGDDVDASLSYLLLWVKPACTCVRSAVFLVVADWLRAILHLHRQPPMCSADLVI